ncbi:MAG: hypothetical protein AABX29_02600 [Nanoarchaeota archaeon]
MEALTKTRKIGGSLVVTIPKVIVEGEGLIEDQMVKIEVEKVKKSGFGLFKGMRSFTKEDELDTHE